MRRRTLVLAGAAGLACSAGATWLVLTSDHEDNKVATLALALIAGISFIASGLVAAWRRPENRTGLLLAAVGYLWALSALTESNDDWLFTAGVALGGLAFGALAHLLLAFPWGVLPTTRDRALVGSAYAVTLLGSLAILLVDETPTASCETCRSTIAVTDSKTASDVLGFVGAALSLAVLVAILVIVVRRFLQASPALRRVLAPVLGAGALAVALLLLWLVVDSIDSGAAAPLRYLFLAAFGMVPLAFLVGVLRSRLDRAAAGKLLLELGHGRPLREALADALRDPSLEIAYWLPERQRFVSAEGKEIREDGSRTAHHVERDGRRVAALLHDPSLAYDPELVEAVAAGAGLWLENERLQAELRAQVHFLETVVETSPSLLCNVDPAGRIANFNLAAAIASGRDDSEAIRHQFFWDVFLRPDERDALRMAFEAGAPEHLPLRLETTFANGRGAEVSIAWSTAPIVDADGNARNIVFGGLDITERKLREVELARERDFLRASEERLRAAIEASPVAIVEYALDDTITRWNPAAERIFGWTAEEVVGGKAKHQPPGHEGELARLFGLVRAGEVYTSVESKRVRKDGTHIDVEISAAPIRDARGNVLSHMALFADITERKRHEEEVRASRARIVQAADEARRLLERNLHDGAQQRLVSLSLTLRLAEKRLQDRPEDAAELLAGARDELASAIEDLRELARGIHPAVLTDRGLDAALDALAARSPVPVEVAVPTERLPGSVEAAAYYVVAESLTNVAKYAQASSASVRVYREDGHALIEVSDDGIGGADADGGTGLSGLADRLAALDGTLVVESPPGGGTRVRATIPVR